MSTVETIDYGQVAVIGEYTTPSGPFFDDHFLVVVHRSGSFYAFPSQRAVTIIPKLEQATGEKVQYGLCNITQLASRIIFPPSLAERPLFVFSKTPFGMGKLWKLIRDFGVDEIHSHLTDEVQNYIINSRYRHLRSWWGIANPHSSHNPRHSPPNPPARCTRRNALLGRRTGS